MHNIDLTIQNCVRHLIVNIKILELVKGVHEEDDAKKKELLEKMKNEIAPAFFKHMTEILTKNGGIYMVGKGVSLTMS